MMETNLHVTMDFMPFAQSRDPQNRYPIKDTLNFAVGIPLAINMTLFKDRDSGTTPYPLPEGIVDWYFVVDRDFDRTTEPLIRVESENITVTQTETLTKIRIECTDTGCTALLEELEERGITDWREIPGYFGELGGYDEDGGCCFVLQIEDIVIRNLLMLADPPQSE